jgi:hypothetical protein
VVEEYSDDSTSGSSMIQRPGLQALVMDSARGRFDMVLAGRWIASAATRVRPCRAHNGRRPGVCRRALQIACKKNYSFWK